MTVAQDTTRQTVSLSDDRLQRLYFLLHGRTPDETAAQEATNGGAKATVAARSSSLEKSLQSLSAQSRAVSELLQLERQYPEPDLSQSDPSTPEPNSVPESTLASSVLSHAPAYHSTSSRLTSLNDSPVPDAASSANILSMIPRIHAAERKQEEILAQIEDLRARSAGIVERWYESGIIDMGECWSEWEGRLRDVDLTVTREEARRRREEEAV